MDSKSSNLFIINKNKIKQLPYAIDKKVINLDIALYKYSLGIKDFKILYEKLIQTKESDISKEENKLLSKKTFQFGSILENHIDKNHKFKQRIDMFKDNMKFECNDNEVFSEQSKDFNYYYIKFINLEREAIFSDIFDNGLLIFKTNIINEVRFNYFKNLVEIFSRNNKMIDNNKFVSLDSHEFISNDGDEIISIFVDLSKKQSCDIEMKFRNEIIEGYILNFKSFFPEKEYYMILNQLQAQNDAILIFTTLLKSFKRYQRSNKKLMIVINDFDVMLNRVFYECNKKNNFYDFEKAHEFLRKLIYQILKCKEYIFKAIIIACSTISLHSFDLIEKYLNNDPTSYNIDNLSSIPRENFNELLSEIKKEYSWISIRNIEKETIQKCNNYFYGNKLCINYLQLKFILLTKVFEEASENLICNTKFLTDFLNKILSRNESRILFDAFMDELLKNNFKPKKIHYQRFQFYDFNSDLFDLSKVLHLLIIANLISIKFIKETQEIKIKITNTDSFMNLKNLYKDRIIIYKKLHFFEKSLVSNLIDGNISSFLNQFQECILNNFSVRQLSVNDNTAPGETKNFSSKEFVYHNLLFGMLMGFQAIFTEEIRCGTEKEQGRGFLDILCLSLKKRIGFIFELKACENFNKRNHSEGKSLNKQNKININNYHIRQFKKETFIAREQIYTREYYRAFNGESLKELYLVTLVFNNKDLEYTYDHYVSKN